ncbi:hypothetical protein CYMTET_8897 [Cymbomonas tetramitiformis]|uniref:beta-N-acetylhexosaminidase n=1 Tax=Cymbomonas tetramitiformis TaxID=36881 RepID=A0AAE0GSR6_9CHLO|nr:hypothetical protein CYMTET_8897 [Cymbomonas tetramitiformis]
MQSQYSVLTGGSPTGAQEVHAGELVTAKQTDEARGASMESPLPAVLPKPVNLTFVQSDPVHRDTLTSSQHDFLDGSSPAGVQEVHTEERVTDQERGPLPTVWPKPVNFTLLESGPCLSVSSTVVNNEGAFSDMDAEFVAALLLDKRGQRSTPPESGLPREDPSALKVTLIRVKGAATDEAYSLEVTKSVATITAASRVGIVHGLQTLKQLIQAANVDNHTKSSAMQVCGLPIHITDAPAFSYRGFLLDSARFQMPVQHVKTLIEVMSFLKYRHLHWHLTDDSSFALPLASLPHAVKDVASYTREEIRQIVRHAYLHAVVIVPELDMPAHAYSWLPWSLNCPKAAREDAWHWKKFPYLTNKAAWGNPLDIGKEGLMEMLAAVFKETWDLLELSPGDMLFHHGGDEVSRDCLHEAGTLEVMRKRRKLLDARGDEKNLTSLLRGSSTRRRLQQAQEEETQGESDGDEDEESVAVSPAKLARHQDQRSKALKNLKRLMDAARNEPRGIKADKSKRVDITLQGFYTKVEGLLEEMGLPRRQVIRWDEILDTPHSGDYLPPKGSIVQCWRALGVGCTHRAARMGYRVIRSNGWYLNVEGPRQEHYPYGCRTWMDCYQTSPHYGLKNSPHKLPENLLKQMIGGEAAA